MTRWHEDDLAGRILEEERATGTSSACPWSPRTGTIPSTEPSAIASGRNGSPRGRSPRRGAIPLCGSPCTSNAPPRSRARTGNGSGCTRSTPSTCRLAAPSRSTEDRTMPSPLIGATTPSMRWSVSTPSDRPWLLDLWRERTTSNVWVRCLVRDGARSGSPCPGPRSQDRSSPASAPGSTRAAGDKRAYTERLQFAEPSRQGHPRPAHARP